MTSLGETAPARVGRVRWRRFALALGPAILLPILLMTLTAQSALAVSLNISGRPFTVTASSLRARDFEEFGILGSSIDLPARDHQVALAATAMRTATIRHLCQTVSVGGIDMIITAGDGSSPVTATNLVVYADRFSGNASFEHLTLGRDAGSLHAVAGVKGPAGGFSLTATSVTITDLVQHAYSTTASSFTLPGFKLSFGGSC
jgi:Family of unknown function (DUF6230)